VKNRTFSKVLLAFVLVAFVASGCGRSPVVTPDAGQARRLLDQVYAGSLKPLKADLEPHCLKGNPDSMTSKASVALLTQYGAAKDLKLGSAEAGPANSTVAVWAVTADRAAYEMKVSYDSSGKIAGIWFWSSALKAWVPSHLFGLDSKLIEQYIK